MGVVGTGWRDELVSAGTAPPVELVGDRHPQRPALDIAVTHALLRAVAAGHPATARVFRPGPTLAFGRMDTLAPGFGAACAAARRHGFTPVIRLGGGHAAAYDEGAVVIDLVEPSAVVAEGIEARFAAGAELVAEALRAAGLEPVLGELPGEYCAGRWSLHLDGRVKIAGLAQRSIRGASLLTAVVVAENGPRVRAVLVDVYAALGIAWDPATAGAAGDLCQGLRSTAIEAALVAAIGRRRPLRAHVLDPAVATAAAQLVAGHEPEPADG